MASKKLGKDTGLNPEQMAFCEAYVTRETFMNGTKSYMSVYKDCQESTARVNSSTLLTNTNILNYIDSLIDDSELDEKRLDKELKKLILQDDDKSAKLQSIKHANELRARVEQGRLNALKKEGEKENKASDMSNEELMRIAYGNSEK